MPLSNRGIKAAVHYCSSGRFSLVENLVSLLLSACVKKCIKSKLKIYVLLRQFPKDVIINCHIIAHPSRCVEPSGVAITGRFIFI